MATKFVTSADGTRSAYETMEQGAPSCSFGSARRAPVPVREGDAWGTREKLHRVRLRQTRSRRERATRNPTPSRARSRICARSSRPRVVGDLTAPPRRPARHSRSKPPRAEPRWRCSRRTSHRTWWEPRKMRPIRTTSRRWTLRPALVESFHAAMDTGGPNAVSRTA